MKFQFKYLFLIFILLLGSSCNNTNYKKVDNLETSRKSINTVNYSINEKFNYSQINCICDRNIISDNLKELSEKKCKIGFNPYFKNNPSGNIIYFIEKIFKEKTLPEIMFKKWER